MTTGLIRFAKATFLTAGLLLARTALAEDCEPTRLHFVPEFDPAAGGAMVALLAGGALFLADRRKRKSDAR